MVMKKDFEEDLNQTVLKTDKDFEDFMNKQSTIENNEKTADSTESKNTILIVVLIGAIFGIAYYMFLI